MNFASAARTPVASRREEKKNDGGDAPIYRREGCIRLRQLPNEVATESEACHRVRKWRRRSAASSYVAPAASRRWRSASFGFLNYLQNCHWIHFSNYSQIFYRSWKSQKMKVAQLFKLYNFALMNIFKFFLHFEIWIWGAFEHLNHFKITPNFICKLEKLWIPKLIHIT